MSNFVFDISLVKFEERFDNEEYNTTTLYFIAPKEWLGDSYPEAIHSEISVEYPFGLIPEANEATVMMSPTKEDEYGNGVDYDWFDIDLSLSNIESLLSLAERSKSDEKI